jgi:hypothetical protein
MQNLLNLCTLHTYAYIIHTLAIAIMATPIQLSLVGVGSGTMKDQCQLVCPLYRFEWRPADQRWSTFRGKLDLNSITSLLDLFEDARTKDMHNEAGKNFFFPINVLCVFLQQECVLGI